MSFRIFSSRSVMIGFTWLLASAVALAAEPAGGAKKGAPAKKPTADSLDDELLKGLGGDPQGDVPDKSVKPAEKPEQQPGQTPGKPDAKKGQGGKSATGDKPANGLDDELLKGLGGEDIGEEKENPLVRLSRQMREAERMMEGGKPGASGQKLHDKQDKIVTDLAKLIEEAKKNKKSQSSSSSSSKSSKQTASRDKTQQPKNSNPSGSNKPNEGSSKESSGQLTKRDAQKPDMAHMNDLLKDVWGQLPERMRQQMLQSSVEEFLPKYELLIEDYFKALSNRQTEK
jgi:hypothetical protein